MRHPMEPMHRSGSLLLVAFALVMIQVKVLPAQALPASQVIRDSAAGVLVPEDTSSSARFNRLMASVERIGLPTARPDPTLNARHFMLVDVRPLLTGENRALLNEALKKQERELTALRSALQAHFELRDALVARNVPMSHVIAVDALTSAGHATVYYLPPQ
ncbi:MAG TPA: hypothetical protein VGE27_06770 [Gemmatimonas sp.]